MTVNLLFGCPSPRDIPEVLDLHPTLPCDIFVVKYKQEYEAYFEIREFFLGHKEYTHLAIACDDIVVKPNHIRRLVKDLELFDYDILSGTMNVEQDDLNIINITPIENQPSPRHEERVYKWLTKQDVVGKGIFECGFSGFPLMIIKREVVMQIPFDADGAANGMNRTCGGSLDVMFCKRAHELGYKIMVDPEVNMFHMRRAGKLRVGAAPPDWYFRPKGSPDVMKDFIRAKQILKKKLENFNTAGGLHNQAANELLEAMANIFLETDKIQ